MDADSLAGDGAVDIPPGRYGTCLARLRWREFLRLGGPSALVAAVVMKLFQRGVVSAARITLPEDIAAGVVARESLDQELVARLDALAAEIAGARLLCHVVNAGFSDPENDARSAGTYHLLAPDTVVFLACGRSVRRDNPAVATRVEMISCASFVGGRVLETTNSSVALDPPPEIDQVLRRGAGPAEIVGLHRERMAGVGARNLTGLDQGAVLALLDGAARHVARDRIRRGVYVRME